MCVQGVIQVKEVHNYKPIEGRGGNLHVVSLKSAVVFFTHFAHACICTGFKKYVYFIYYCIISCLALAHLLIYFA